MRLGTRGSSRRLQGAPRHHGLNLPLFPQNGVPPQVYAGNVLYEHEMPPEPFWEVHDTLELQLSSPPALDVAATLVVSVSFEAACPQRPSRLWRNKGELYDGEDTGQVQKGGDTRPGSAAPLSVPRIWEVKGG